MARSSNKQNLPNKQQNFRPTALISIICLLFLKIKTPRYNFYSRKDFTGLKSLDQITPTISGGSMTLQTLRICVLIPMASLEIFLMFTQIKLQFNCTCVILIYCTVIPRPFHHFPPNLCSNYRHCLPKVSWNYFLADIVKLAAFVHKAKIKCNV